MKPKRSIPVSARPPPSVPSSASRAHAATHTRSPAHAPESSAPNPPSSRNRRPRRISTTTRINSFHALSKRIAHLKKSGASDLEIDQVRLQIDALGGLHAYQRASLKGGDERSGRGACGKWLASKLEPIFLSKAKLSSSPSCHKLRLLDVGALNGQTYERYSSWIAAEYIDLNPQHSNVIRQDFFERPLPKIDSDKFDVICLCLVVNFVDDPARRGIMLKRAREFLVNDGFLFLVLPRACTENSRYMTHERLLEVCAAVGFSETGLHRTPRLTYHLWQAAAEAWRVTGTDPNKCTSKGTAKAILDHAPAGRRVEKRVVNAGGGRNNFCIVVD